MDLEVEVGDAARELGDRGGVQAQPRDRELERQRGGAAVTGGRAKAPDAHARDRLAARLAGVARRDHRHRMAGAHERLGLAPHADVLRIGVVLEQHRDAMPSRLAHVRRTRRPPLQTCS